MKTIILNDFSCNVGQDDLLNSNFVDKSLAEKLIEIYTDLALIEKSTHYDGPGNRVDL